MYVVFEHFNLISFSRSLEKIYHIAQITRLSFEVLIYDYVTPEHQRFRTQVLQTMDTTLGKAYSVISRRRGKILKEEMIEGTAIFVIESHIPVAESFGLASELRKSTSGAVMNPQLEFLCFKLLDVDPFFQPKTLEEREEHGEVLHDGQVVNLARNYIDAVRKRKGLFVHEKVVVSAEKQRTRSKRK